jgi:hypothetical protein
LGEYNFADEPEESEPRPFVRLTYPNVKTWVEYEVPYGDGTARLGLEVDEESSLEDLKAEYAFWEKQAGYEGTPMFILRPTWKVLQWLEFLISRAS